MWLLLYSCMFPTVEAREAASSISSMTVEGMGSGLYRRIDLCSRISFIIVVFLWYNPYKGSNSCGGCDRTRFDFAWPCLPGKEQIPCIFRSFFSGGCASPAGGMTP